MKATTGVIRRPACGNHLSRYNRPEIIHILSWLTKVLFSAYVHFTKIIIYVFSLQIISLNIFKYNIHYNQYIL